MTHRFLLAVMLAASPFWLAAQLHADFSIGVSNQDNYASVVGIHHSFSERFTAGMQVQYGRPNYRFVSAQTFQDQGFSTTVSVPLLIKVSTSEKVTLAALVHPGVRVQGIIDPDDNDLRDSTFSSTAVLFEYGMLVGIPIHSKFTAQSGVTFPVLYEVAPTSLFENMTTLIHAGMLFHPSEEQTWFIKANWGSAFGANGDSQKFNRSVLIGYRRHLGQRTPQEVHLIHTAL